MKSALCIRASTRKALQRDMINKYEHNDLTWIDLESPTKEEVRTVMDEYDIHPVAAGELLSPTLRPKVEAFKDHLYVVLHFPAKTYAEQANRGQEIDFIIGAKLLITVHYEHIDTFNSFAKIFEVDSTLDNTAIGSNAVVLLYYMLTELYQNLGHEFDYIHDNLTEIEDGIFSGREALMVEKISLESRRLLNFQQTIKPHEQVLVSLDENTGKFFGGDLSYYMHAIQAEYFKIATALENARDALSELRQTNDSLLTAKTNDVMRILTIMAFVMFPLSVVAALFGMRTSTMPIIGTPHDFWIVIAIMFALAGSVFTFFKYKGWL